MFLVATNVIASRPPKRRPTGTPHARANSVSYHVVLYQIFDTDMKYHNICKNIFIIQFYSTATPDVPPQYFICLGDIYYLLQYYHSLGRGYDSHQIYLPNLTRQIRIRSEHKWYEVDLLLLMAWRLLFLCWYWVDVIDQGLNFIL